MRRGVSYAGNGTPYNPASVAITGGTITGVTSVGSSVFLAGDGSQAAPSYAFTADTALGFLRSGTKAVGLGNGNSVQLWWFATNNSARAIFAASAYLGWSIAAGFDSTQSNEDVRLYRDAAATLALKNSTNAQTLNLYGSEITAGTRYSRLAIKHATTTLASVSGATVTATSLIPAKANVLGVNTIVTVALGTGSGTTGYTVGDGSDADRWGVVAGTVAGTDTDGADATADPTGWFTAASNVVITAAGGNFNGTGSIFVDVAYTITEAD